MSKGTHTTDKRAEKVAHLIRLAAGADEEARTAAHTACRLIREAGLLVIHPSDPRLSGGLPDWLDMFKQSVARDQSDEAMRHTAATAAEAARRTEEILNEMAKERAEREERDDLKRQTEQRWAHEAAAQAEVYRRKTTRTGRPRKSDLPRAVVLPDEKPCKRCGNLILSGRRAWQFKGETAIMCGICWNGCP